MIHNIVIVDNKEYQAVPHHNCDGCAFLCNATMCEHMTCGGFERADSTSVIFKPHYKPTKSELIGCLRAIRSNNLGRTK